MTVTMSHDQSQILIAEAKAYGLLSHILTKPSQNLVKAVNELIKLFKDSPEMLPLFRNMLSILAETEGNFMAMTVDYSRLFIGPFEMLAPPYAELYLGSKQQLNGNVTQEIRNIYKEYGAYVKKSTKDLPDHISILFEFMYFLMEHYVKTGDERYINMYELFGDRYIRSWIRKLADNIMKHHTHLFYGEAAKVIYAIGTV